MFDAYQKYSLILITLRQSGMLLDRIQNIYVIANENLDKQRVDRKYIFEIVFKIPKMLQ